MDFKEKYKVNKDVTEPKQNTRKYAEKAKETIELSNSPELEEYLITVGKCIRTRHNRLFPEISTDFVARIKSQKSIYDKFMRLPNEKDFNSRPKPNHIYDTIGFECTIKDLPVEIFNNPIIKKLPDYYMNNFSIMRSKSMLKFRTINTKNKYLKDRLLSINYTTLTENQKEEYYRIESYLNFYTALIAREGLNSEVTSKRSEYTNQNEIAKNSFATILIDTLLIPTNNEIFDSKYDTENISDRRKHFSKEYGYTSEHATLLCTNFRYQSDIFPLYWELQVKSLESHIKADYGTDAHYCREGKKRDFPRKHADINSTYINAIKKRLPKRYSFPQYEDNYHKFTTAENFEEYYKVIPIMAQLNRIPHFQENTSCHLFYRLCNSMEGIRLQSNMQKDQRQYDYLKYTYSELNPLYDQIPKEEKNKEER